MNEEEVNNMINALANAYYLYFMHYAEEMENNTETLEEYQKELKESIKTKTEYRNTLKELTEIKEKANGTDNKAQLTIALSLIAVVIITVLTLYIH